MNREGDRLSPFLHYRNLYVPKKYLTLYIIPYLFTPSLFSFGALRTDRRTDKVLHPLFPKFFFSLSARGPTPRRNFTGLAKLRGGWPIEQVGGRRHEAIRWQAKQGCWNTNRWIRTYQYATSSSPKQSAPPGWKTLTTLLRNPSTDSYVA
jgi:hypothetical protein